MLLPFLATIQVATPERLLILIESPAVGDAGNVSVKFAVNTYKFPFAAVVFQEITDTPMLLVAVST